MMQYLLAHDLGTSGNKATLYDVNGNLVASDVSTYSTYYPQPGFVEQNANEWWEAVCYSTKALIAKAKVEPSQIKAVSFSGQMMGCLLVDKQGDPLMNSIIWADTRGEKQASLMQESLTMDYVYETTGHRISSSYSCAKLLWIRDNLPETYNKAYKMLNAKDYIVWKLTGVFATDYSDASGTNLFDIKEKVWSSHIVETLNINPDLLPELYPSTHIAGGVTPEAAELTGLAPNTPIVLGGGDGSCACVGAGVVKPGNAYNVLGSSSWISMASEEPYNDPKKQVFNWVHLDPNLYTPCGTMQAAGYSFKWYTDTLCQGEKLTAKAEDKSFYDLINADIQGSNPGADGLLYLPYLLGERSPHWDADAKGNFVGLNISTSKGDMSRAVLEGVGFNLKIILDILEEHTKVDEISLIGGGAQNQVWLQILSDIWQKKINVPVYIEEATSMGAAICAGIGVGIYEDFSVIEKFNHTVRQITPNTSLSERYNSLYHIFKESYTALKPVFKMIKEYQEAYTLSTGDDYSG